MPDGLACKQNLATCGHPYFWDVLSSQRLGTREQLREQLGKRFGKIEDSLEFAKWICLDLLCCKCRLDENMGLVNVDLQWEVFLGEHMLLLLQRKASQIAIMGCKMHQTSQPTTMISIQSQTSVVHVVIDHTHTHIQLYTYVPGSKHCLCGMIVHPDNPEYIHTIYINLQWVRTI